MAASRFLIRVAVAPADPEASEVLELVLAGSSLDINVAVVFEGQGCLFLSEPWVRGWRQLIDFDLATLYYRAASDVPAGLEALAVPIDEQALARLCAHRQELRV